MLNKMTSKIIYDNKENGFHENETEEMENVFALSEM